MSTNEFSIVIPAHNESADIGDVLASLVPIAERAEIVVVANGCSDDTAEIARAAAPWALLLELEAGSKPGALNAGDAAATVFPRLYLDGDVRIAPEHVLAMRDALDADGVIAVGATPKHDLSASSWVVRSHYRIWEQMSTNRTGLGGANPQMLSQSARERFDAWPDVIGDDYFLDGLFDEREGVRVPSVPATRTAPSGTWDCVSRKARVHAGNVAVAERALRAGHSGGGLNEAVRVVRRRPFLVVHLPAHLVISVGSRVLYRWRKLRGTEGLFYRDESRN